MLTQLDSGYPELRQLDPRWLDDESHSPNSGQDAVSQDMAYRKAHRILEHLQTAVLVCDPGLVVLYLNSAAQALLGISEPRAVGEALMKVLPFDDELLGKLDLAVSSDQPITLREVVIKLPSALDEIAVDCTATPMGESTGADGEITGLLIELAAIDRLMRLARESAWRDAHAANQAVIRGVAHEIKNPLGGLRGAAQLLERQFDAPELHEYTRIIISEADRLRALVDRMAGPARPFSPEPTNIHAVTEHVRSLLLADSAEGISILSDYDPSLPEIAAESGLLIQALLNLVKNAIEAVGDSGIIVLKTRVERQLTIGQRRHRQVVRIDVIDNGPGVPKALQDTLFYPLVTGRAEGTGLGLAITQDIVSRHSGLMDFDSEPGKTSFTLFLPIE